MPHLGSNLTLALIASFVAGCIEPAQQVLRDLSSGTDAAPDVAPPEDTVVAPEDVPEDVEDAGDTTVGPADTADVAVEPDVVSAPTVTLERISPEQVSYFAGKALREPLRFRIVKEGEGPPPSLTFAVEIAPYPSDVWTSRGDVQSDVSGVVSWSPGPISAAEVGGHRVRFTATRGAEATIAFRVVPAKIEDLALGPRHGCLVTGGGELMCWGENGEAGVSSETRPLPMTSAVRGGAVPEPMRVPTPGPVHDVAVFGGFDGEPNGSGEETQTTCISVRPDAGNTGGVYCVGHGGVGELGQGETADAGGWVQVTRATDGGAAPLPFARELSGAGRFACAIVDESANSEGVWCWGRGEDGQLGASTPTEGPKVRLRAVLAHTNDGGQHLEGLETGPGNVCVQRTTGESASSGLPTGHVVCWGSNAKLQLGQADEPGGVGTSVFFPDPMPPLCDAMVGSLLDELPLHATATGPVAVGGAHVCAVVRTDGVDANDLSVLTAACGADAVAASVVCAGEDDDGQRGSTRSDELVSWVERTDRGRAIGFTQLTAGLAFTCAVDKAGGVSCWGDNTDGQIGLSRNIAGESLHPSLVHIASGGATASPLFTHRIRAAPRYACVLAGPSGERTYSDAVVCWGSTVAAASGQDPCENNGEQEPCPEVPRALVLR